ncbi:TusE/DsrC/DsvC family sulfur relay protein [Pseudomonas sp.]|uniref:TusE/DsrC/DsvC family sulfur relay protein n=1 Tax=Pseudomonas sp. TaxID=306 RepID=UPI00338D5C2E
MAALNATKEIILHRVGNGRPGPKVSRYLFRLFPEGPAKQATKIAGLPKPANCI